MRKIWKVLAYLLRSFECIIVKENFNYWRRKNEK
ncbi:hypothetical protein IYC_06841 [Clostridium sporogenes PA 3679]|nr:hypothetical protein IYC_06841 [Clostridium sporogenes PA 3679]